MKNNTQQDVATVQRDREIVEAALRFAGFAQPGIGAIVDKLHPLPAPEPQQAQGPSGWAWELTACSLDMRRDGRAYGLTLPPEDRATVANLLCPFEDVVRATLEELYVTSIECHGDAHNLVTNESRNAFLGNLPLFLPLILKRLSQ